MRAHEILTEYAPPALINKTVDVDGIQLSINADGANVTVYALSDGRQLGYVVFDRVGNNLVADDLAVEERYQGQGIAKIMYDYVKHELGFNIERSWNQTDAGKGFWKKHRGRKRFWESVQAYHGTFQPTLTQFNALSHFGTLQAAEDRLKEKARREKIQTPGRVYEVVLDIKNPFIAKDFSGVHSPTHFVSDLKSAKLISQEELEAINQHLGTPKQAELLIKKLRELGFDGIAYKNKYEDRGSTSYVILDPSQVISIKPVEQKEEVTENKQLDPEIYGEFLPFPTMRKIIQSVVHTVDPDAKLKIKDDWGTCMVEGEKIRLDFSITADAGEITAYIVNAYSSYKGAGIIQEILRQCFAAMVQLYGQPQKFNIATQEDRGHGVWQHMAQKLGAEWGGSNR